MRKLLDTLSTLVRPRRALQPALANALVNARYQRRAAYRHHPGHPGVEPTRFGDWEYNGRCADFG